MIFINFTGQRNTNYFGDLDYEHDEKEKNWNSFESTLETLKKFIDKGKLDILACQTKLLGDFLSFYKLPKKRNASNSVSSNPYNLVNRTYEVGIAEISMREKTGLLAYSPLQVI